MLLESLKAVNFRGFREILLPPLPEGAVVSVGGEDPEAFREVISFALFGLPPPESLRIIRPGARYAYVELTLRLPEGRICLLRGTDRTGQVRVSLRELDRRCVQNRPDEVAERLAELVPIPGAEVARHLLGDDTGEGDPAVRADPGGTGRSSDVRRSRRECRQRIATLRARLASEVERLSNAPEPVEPCADPEALAAAGAALADAIRASISPERLEDLRREAREAASRVTRVKRELESGIARLQAEKRALARPEPAGSDGGGEREEEREEPRRGMELAFATMLSGGNPSSPPAAVDGAAAEEGEREIRLAAIDAEIVELRRRRAEAVRFAGRIQEVRSRFGTAVTLEFHDVGDMESVPDGLDGLEPRVAAMERMAEGPAAFESGEGPSPAAALRALHDLSFRPACGAGCSPDEIPPDELLREVGEEVERLRRLHLREDAVEEVRSIASRRARAIRAGIRIEEECLAGLSATEASDPEESGILPDLVAFLSEGRFRRIERDVDGSLVGVKRDGRTRPIAAGDRLGLMVDLARRMRAAGAALGDVLSAGRFAVIDRRRIPAAFDAADLVGLIHRVSTGVRQVFVLGPIGGGSGHAPIEIVQRGDTCDRRLGPASVGLVDLGRSHRPKGLSHGAAHLR